MAHGTTMNVDLVAHFFRRADRLLGPHGTIGLIATNTVGQGDTREGGLQHIVRSGGTIYEAWDDMPWPGDAAVTVAVVHIARGRPALALATRLNGHAVERLNSRLAAGGERADPAPLHANASFAYNGVFVMGIGFAVSVAEREQLVARSARNATRLRPYQGGEELNANPDQGFDRYVIDFSGLTLEEAAGWPDLLEIVRTRVKPDRDRQKDASARDNWWTFFRPRPELYTALRGLPRCIATSRHAKHLTMTFVPTDRVLSEATYVFPLASTTAFATLQCRVHERWARLLASSLKTDLRYSASDCFETFPFPRPDPQSVVPELEVVGQRLYDARASYMTAPDTQVGLTTTYNRLKNPAETDARIVELRRLHEEMDTAVLAAYGWHDIVVPPFCIATPADQAALDRFETQVIDRLFALNATRSVEERLGGSESPAPAGASIASKPKAKISKKNKKNKKNNDDGAQGSLL